MRIGAQVASSLAAIHQAAVVHWRTWRLNDSRATPSWAPADVYALGILLYRLLAGRSPWLVERTMQMLAAHVSDSTTHAAARGGPRLRRLVAPPEPGQEPRLATERARRRTAPRLRRDGQRRG